jgi:hypothetical protein
MESPVTVLELVEVADSGKQTPIRVEVGQPYSNPDSHGEWICSVLVRGIDHKAKNIYGAHSLQALCLGLAYVRSRLETVLKRGSRLVDLEENNDFPLEACFGELTHTTLKPKAK